jgi:hypothetical protein
MNTGFPTQAIGESFHTQKAKASNSCPHNKSLDQTKTTGLTSKAGQDRVNTIKNNLDPSQRRATTNYSLDKIGISIGLVGGGRAIPGDHPEWGPITDFPTPEINIPQSTSRSQASKTHDDYRVPRNLRDLPASDHHKKMPFGIVAADHKCSSNAILSAN